MLVGDLIGFYENLKPIIETIKNTAKKYTIKSMSGYNGFGYKYKK